MTLAATRVGVGFPRRTWKGSLLSLHEAAANLRHDSGLVLSLVTRADLMTARSVEIPLPHGFASLASILEREAPVAGDGEILSLGRLEIDLRRAPFWSGKPSPRLLGARAGGGPRAELSHTAALLGEALAEVAGTGGLGELARDPGGSNPFARRCGELLATIEKGGAEGRTRHAGGWRQGAAAAGRRAAGIRIRGLSRLVGLGVGLTPSGDDFLAGALLGERFARIVRPASPAPRIERGEIAPALSGTTAPGRALLWLALCGSFPAYLLELARGVAAARGLAAMRSAVMRAAAHGATSGIDAVTGLWWYLTLMHEGGHAPSGRA